MNKEIAGETRQEAVGIIPGSTKKVVLNPLCVLACFIFPATALRVALDCAKDKITGITVQMVDNSPTHLIGTFRGPVSRGRW